MKRFIDSLKLKNQIRGGSMSDKYEKLENIKRLLDEGTLSEQEFQEEKEKILSLPDEDNSSTKGKEHWGLDENNFCLALHLSQFAGYTIPLAGLILPIVMWMTEKEKSRRIDIHGRIVVNWIISSVIYGILFLILAFFFIGIPLLIILGLLYIIYPIIGAIKAGDGKTWRYPLTINFLALPEYHDDEL